MAVCFYQLFMRWRLINKSVDSVSVLQWEKSFPSSDPGCRLLLYRLSVGPPSLEELLVLCLNCTVLTLRIIYMLIHSSTPCVRLWCWEDFLFFGHQDWLGLDSLKWLDHLSSIHFSLLCLEIHNIQNTQYLSACGSRAGRWQISIL